MHICVASSFDELMKSIYLLKIYRTNLLICTKSIQRYLFAQASIYIHSQACQVDQIADRRILIIQIHYAVCVKF